MSLLPIESINAYRKNIDMIIEIYGIPCKLYLVKNIEAQEKIEVYQESPELVFEAPIDTKVWIEWQPTAKMLRNMGIFVEEQLPIIAFLRLDHSATRNSYIKIKMQYDTGVDQDEEFELVDRVLRRAYDASVVECWQIAPRRRQ